MESRRATRTEERTPNAAAAHERVSVGAASAVPGKSSADTGDVADLVAQWLRNCRLETLRNIRDLGGFREMLPTAHSIFSRPRTMVAAGVATQQPLARRRRACLYPRDPAWAQLTTTMLSLPAHLHPAPATCAPVRRARRSRGAAVRVRPRSSRWLRAQLQLQLPRARCRRP